MEDAMEVGRITDWVPERLGTGETGRDCEGAFCRPVREFGAGAGVLRFLNGVGVVSSATENPIS